MFQILACQLTVPEDVVNARARDRHLEETAQKIRNAAASRSPDLIVLPELSAIDYSREAFGNLGELAEQDDGPSFKVFSALARELSSPVAYGYPACEGDRYRIRQAIAGPSGELTGCYDKLHLAQYGASMEKEYFSRGDRLHVFEAGGLKIAPIICYDIRIPELCRTLALQHDVDLILHCGAYYRDQSFATWHDFARTRAIENQIFLLSLNRAGRNYGHSIFCRPWMDDATPAMEFPDTDEAFRMIEIDPDEIRRVRTAYSFLKDRRDSYR